MGMFGRSSGALTPLGTVDSEPSLGAQLLNVAGRNLLGVDFLNEDRKRKLRATQNDFLSSLISKLGPPQYQDGPAPVVALPPGPAEPSPSIKASAPGLFGSQAPQGPQDTAANYQYHPPVRTSGGLDINSPEMSAIALKAQLLGVPITQMIEVMKAQQPDVNYDRGFGYNKKTGAPMGAFHPELDKGQALGPNGQVMNLPGAVQSAADMAGGVEGAKAAATAPYQFQTVTGPDGRPRVISNATAAALGSTGGIIAAGPSPAQTAADTARASAGASADIGLPQTLSNANQTLQVIDALKSHPALGDRTGLRAVLPAIPGTQGADFDALAAQLKGKLFLQAYGDLKGGGQITEVEGKKATEAMARLNQTQSREGYVKALNDLGDVIRAGAERAQAQAQRLQPVAGARPSAPSAPAPSRDAVAAELRRRGLLK
jgi:hypothetical protein